MENAGLGILLELLESTNLKHQRDGCVALSKLAEKASSLSPVDAGPPSPISQVSILFSCRFLYICVWRGVRFELENMGHFYFSDDEFMIILYMKHEVLPLISANNLSILLQVYLGEQYVNNPTLSDVTFVIGGETFFYRKDFFFILMLAESYICCLWY